MKQLLTKMALSLCCVGYFAQVYAVLPLSQAPKCPSASLIKAAGLSQVHEMENGIYAVIQVSDYGTMDQWGFGLIGIEAKSQREAMKKGLQILPAIEDASSPTRLPDGAGWLCLYPNSSNILAGAITPVPDETSVYQTLQMHHARQRP